MTQHRLAMRLGLTFLIGCIYSVGLGNSNEWTWIGGSNSANRAGVYGDKGVPDLANIPGARREPVFWTDTNGDLWLFGGWGYSSLATFGYLNDLWKYSPSNGQWTWVHGSAAVNSTGVYGSQETSSSVTVPCARREAVSWIDNDGKFWLFGGQWSGPEAQSGGFLNDLWQYDPSLNRWACINGNQLPNQSGVYGIQGVADTQNTPGARDGSVGWTDTSGNLWLFGGDGYDQSGASDRLNDLWKFDVSCNKWTWVKGSNLVASRGVYGEIGVATSDAAPSSRDSPVGWTDIDGCLWLFAGWGYGASGPASYMNDLWKYNPVTDQWTWVNGSNVTNQNGVYGIQGTLSPTNQPGARSGAGAWMDRHDRPYILGGYGAAASGFGGLNDLWRYEPSSNQWVWVNGSGSVNANNIYGILGAPSPTNTLGARSGSAVWIDSQNRLYLFGGWSYAQSDGNKRLNDLWKYTPVQDSGINWDQVMQQEEAFSH